MGGTPMPHKTSMPPRGLTLVELLIVMVILTILVSLIAGGSMWVRATGRMRDTTTRVTIIHAALQAYFDKAGQYPPDGGADHGGQLLRQRLTDASDPGGQSHIAGVKAAMEVLQQLPQSAFERGQTTFTDAYGQAIGYIADGGLGGVPVVISAGPDGNFDTDDDIRSDRL